MLIKLINHGSQQFEVPAASLIKISSAGLRGHDLNELIKRSSHEFVDALKKTQIKSGEVPIHLIAMGSTEYFGPNRNFDGWREDELKKTHHSFVKYAKMYRNHSNKDKSISYGVVKSSMYNDSMHRVELLVFLNGTKEAAERNNGLIADKELQKLESNSEIPVSMSAKVAYDVCVGCGNKAKNRAEYCLATDEGGHCKRGGCRHNLGKVCEDGQILYVDNPDPTFFDISHVFRPADRIAYVLGKAASHKNIGGAELAELSNLTLPQDLLLAESPIKAANYIKLAYKLAALENSISNDAFSLMFTKTALDESSYTEAPSDVWSVLAAAKVCVPLDGFLSIITNAPVKEATVSIVAKHLPGIYNRLIKSGELIDLLDDNCYAATNFEVNRSSWVKDKLQYSLDINNVNRRITKVAMYQPTVELKTPLNIVNSAAELIAKQYALYKLAFLNAIEKDDKDFNLTCKLAVRQNYV